MDCHASHGIAPGEVDGRSMHRATGDTSTEQSAMEAKQHEMLQLMQKQMEVIQNILAQNTTTLPQEILDVLRRIDARQENADVSRKPVIRAPSTSAAAWTPLLRSHLEYIQPTIDRWRGTLDTLLIFIGLFSAIVTTFFTQSLTGLSQDPGDRTNELLQNLTEIIIATSGINASQLSIDLPTSFQPADSAVRVNFYWSISLTLSISVAALAVVIRGYVSVLTRSRHNQAYKKLGDLHRRWGEANKLLAPAVEYLSQLLIPPVVLFVIGLIDTVISSSIPTSESTVAIFLAGILSMIFAIAVATYAIWTVYHGFADPDVSPFQSTLLAIWRLHGPSVATNFEQIYHYVDSLFHHCRIWLRNVYNHLLSRDTPSNHPSQDDTLVKRRQETNEANALSNDIIEPHVYKAFHATLLVTQEDTVIDQAVTAFAMMTVHRMIFAAGRDAPIFHSLNQDEIDSLCYMLSDEASLRANITAATFLASPSSTIPTDIPIVHHENNNIQYIRYSPTQAVQLSNYLVRAAEKYSASITGKWRSHVLWDSPFVVAMDMVLWAIGERRRIAWSKKIPVIRLLLMTVPESPEISSQLDLREFAWQIVQSKIMQIGGSQQSIDAFSNHPMDLFLEDAGNGVDIAHLVDDPMFRQKLSENLMGDELRDGYTLTWVIGEHFQHAWYESIEVTGRMVIARWLVKCLRTCNNIRFPSVRYLECILYSLECVVVEIHADLAETADPKTLPVSQIAFEWITFILKEVNDALDTVHYKSSTDAAAARALVARACVDVILGSQAFDTRGATSSKWKSFDRLHFCHDTNDSQGEPSPILCSSLCRLKTEILRSIEFVRHKSPSETAIRLETDLWERLERSLTSTSSQSADWRDGGPWTTVTHREQVKQEVYKALRFLSPYSSEAESSTPAAPRLEWYIGAEAVIDRYYTLIEDERRSRGPGDVNFDVDRS